MTIIEAMRDPKLFGPWFKGSSWDNWQVFLKALFGLDLAGDELETFTQFTGRQVAPDETNEAWLIVGRRGGKSLIAALVAVFLACFKDYQQHLARGERGTVMVIAADRKQARVVMRFVMGFLECVPMLKREIESQTKESVNLKGQLSIEVHTANFRLVRGYSIVACVADEIAFWRSEDSASPDTEIINAIRPGMASIPGSMLLCLSSPYARRGELWKTYKKHYGKDSSILVWKAESRAMNATIPQRIVDQALEEDPAAASAEWLAEFRRDVEGFVTQEAAENCVIPGRIELPPVSGVHYYAFVDPSGGSQDSMTLAIAHKEGNGAVVDAVRERRAPFAPEGVVEEFSKLLKTYRISSVSGDRYAGEWPAEQFKKRGIRYLPAGKSKSVIYGEILPMVNSRQVEFLDNPRMMAQLCSLERRTSRSGRDSIDHGPGGHDDLINAVAGVVVGIGLRSTGRWRPILTAEEQEEQDDNFREEFRMTL